MSAPLKPPAGPVGLDSPRPAPPPAPATSETTQIVLLALAVVAGVVLVACFFAAGNNSKRLLEMERRVEDLEKRQLRHELGVATDAEAQELLMRQFKADVDAAIKRIRASQAATPEPWVVREPSVSVAPVAPRPAARTPDADE